MSLVFFSPTFNRTGSEKALFNILHAINAWVNDMVIVSFNDGELLANAPQKAKVHVRKHSNVLERVYSRVYERLYKSDRFLDGILKKYGKKIWYINTLALPHVVKFAKEHDIPCILHCHELENIFNVLSEEDFLISIEYPQLIIVCSKAVEQTIRLAGRTSSVEVLYESINLCEIQTSLEQKRSIRRELSIGDDTFVWAMSGTIDARKNASLFVDLAYEFSKRKVKTHFMWIGDYSSGYSSFVKRKADNFGIKVSWVGLRKEDYYDYLNVADGFVLTSSMDPFPLVMIEAAALCKPIVSFNSGGVKEFLKPGMGVLVDSWNSTDLMAAMVKVMNGEIHIDRMMLRKEAEMLDFRVQSEKWKRLIEKYFGDKWKE